MSTRPHLSKGWFAIGALAGAAVATAGWALNHFANWGSTVESVSVNVGTSIGLVGVLVAVERRMERRAEVVLERVAARVEAAVQAGAAAPTAPAPVRPRDEVVTSYEAALSGRPPPEHRPEEVVLDEWQRARDRHDLHVETARRDVERELAERFGADAAMWPTRYLAVWQEEHGAPSLFEPTDHLEAWASLVTFAAAAGGGLPDGSRQLVDALAAARLEADPPPCGGPPPHVDAEFDPARPFADWWEVSANLHLRHRWAEEFPRVLMPSAGVEVAARLRVANAYANSADAATGLAVVHRTALACLEALEIAFDVAYFQARPWFAGNFRAASESRVAEARWALADPTLVPPRIGTSLHRLRRVEQGARPGTRLLVGFDQPPGSSEPWAHRQELLTRPVGRLLRHAFRTSLTLPLVEETSACIEALRLPAFAAVGQGATTVEPATSTS